MPWRWTPFTMAMLSGCGGKTTPPDREALVGSWMCPEVGGWWRFVEPIEIGPAANPSKVFVNAGDPSCVLVLEVSGDTATLPGCSNQSYVLPLPGGGPLRLGLAVHRAERG